MATKRILSLLTLFVMLLAVGVWLFYPGPQLTERRLQTLNDLLGGAVVTSDGNFPTQGFVVISSQGYQMIEQEPQLQWRLSRALEEERIIIAVDICCQDFFGLVNHRPSAQLHCSQESRRYIQAWGITLRNGELFFQEEQISRRRSVNRMAEKLIDFALSIEEEAEQSDGEN